MLLLSETSALLVGLTCICMGLAVLGTGARGTRTVRQASFAACATLHTLTAIAYWFLLIEDFARTMVPGLAERPTLVVLSVLPLLLCVQTAALCVLARVNRSRQTFALSGALLFLAAFALFFLGLGIVHRTLAPQPTPDSVIVVVLAQLAATLAVVGHIVFFCVHWDPQPQGGVYMQLASCTRIGTGKKTYQALPQLN